MRPRAAITVLALALVALSPGCGTDETREGPPFEPGNIEDQQSLLITDSDIEEVGPSTPYGAALRWWKALQLADVKGVQRSYASRISGKKARRQILEFQPPFSQPLHPKVETQGNRATMDVVVRTTLPLPASESVTRVVDFPTRFHLLRNGAGWRVLVRSFRNFTEARPFEPRVGS